MCKSKRTKCKSEPHPASFENVVSINARFKTLDVEQHPRKYIAIHTTSAEIHTAAPWFIGPIELLRAARSQALQPSTPLK